MKILKLSYDYSKSIPVYGNSEQKIDILKLKCQNNGDSCNTYQFTLQNHWGTHIDCPAHFFTNQKSITDYNDNFWHIENVQLIDASINVDNLITSTKILKELKSTTELLFIKTGFCYKREQKEYALENPGLDPDMAKTLRRDFPRLKIIGIDSISASSFLNRPIGRIAHQEYLDENKHGHPILLLEDVNLQKISESSNILEVIISPLFIEGLDSAPVTVWLKEKND